MALTGCQTEIDISKPSESTVHAQDENDEINDGTVDNDAGLEDNSSGSDNTDDPDQNGDLNTDGSSNTDENDQGMNDNSDQNASEEDDISENIQPAKLLSPVNNTHINQPKVTFVLDHFKSHLKLKVFTSSNVIFDGVVTNNPTIDIPLTGETIKVTLETFINNQWVSNSYQYTTEKAVEPEEPEIEIPLANLVAPIPNVKITDSNIVFKSDNTTQEMWLDVGTIKDQDGNLFNAQFSGEALVNIPLNGKPIYVILWTSINGEWKKQHYQFETAFIEPEEPESNVDPISNNQAPLAMDDAFSTQFNQPYSGTLNAVDVENDNLTFEMVNAPRNGSVYLNASTAEFEYTPDNNGATDDTFSYRAFDGEHYSNTATISIRLSQYASKTLMGQSNGIGADLVIIGDGFTASEMDKFDQAVQDYVSFMFNYEPEFTLQQKAWNVHQIQVISNESGADNSDGNNQVDTALDSYFNCGNIDRLLCVNANKTFDVVNSVFPQWDNILVIVNHTKYGGAGYGSGIGTFSLSSSAKHVALHEMGHSFARLGDEYTYGKTTPLTREPSAVNLTINNNSESIKWKHWLGYGDDSALIDLFEGGSYLSSGVWRPSKNSIMKSLGNPFHAVNKEAWTLKLYEHAGTYQYKFPVDNEISKSANETITFNVEGSLAEGAQDYRWYINNVEKEEFRGKNLIEIGQQISIDSQVRVDISDRTQVIRKDTSKHSSDSIQWSIKIREL